jgi:hypothetical protein
MNELNLGVTIQEVDKVTAFYFELMSNKDLNDI